MPLQGNIVQIATSYDNENGETVYVLTESGIVFERRQKRSVAARNDSGQPTKYEYKEYWAPVEMNTEEPVDLA